MKYAAYHAAAHPEPHRILGRLLRPYSLGHVELLHAAESNLILDAAESAQISWDDLALSILLCERSYEEGAELIWKIRSDPKFALAHCRRMEQWGRTLHKPNLEEACLAFLKYVEAGSRTINIRYPENPEGLRNEAPEHQLVKVHFLFNASLTETQIMNRPWGLARSEWMTHLALQGVVTTLTDEDGESEDRAALNQKAEEMPPIPDGTSYEDTIRIIRDWETRRGSQTTSQEAPCEP